MGDPSIEERIADIHKRHCLLPGVVVTRCMCGVKLRGEPSYRDEHAAHVAAAVVAELLTQEWGSRSPEGWGPWTIYHGKSDAEGSARRSDVLHSRFVTNWERAE